MYFAHPIANHNLRACVNSTSPQNKVGLPQSTSHQPPIGGAVSKDFRVPGVPLVTSEENSGLYATAAEAVASELSLPSLNLWKIMQETGLDRICTGLLVTCRLTSVFSNVPSETQSYSIGSSSGAYVVMKQMIS